MPGRQEVLLLLRHTYRAACFCVKLPGIPKTKTNNIYKCWSRERNNMIIMVVGWFRTVVAKTDSCCLGVLHCMPNIDFVCRRISFWREDQHFDSASRLVSVFLLIVITAETVSIHYFTSLFVLCLFWCRFLFVFLCIFAFTPGKSIST